MAAEFQTVTSHIGPELKVGFPVDVQTGVRVAGGVHRRVDMLKTSSFRSEVSSSSMSPSLADTAMNHQRGSGDSPDTSRRNSGLPAASPLGRPPGR